MATNELQPGPPVILPSIEHRGWAIAKATQNDSKQSSAPQHERVGCRIRTTFEKPEPQMARAVVHRDVLPEVERLVRPVPLRSRLLTEHEAGERSQRQNQNSTHCLYRNTGMLSNANQTTPTQRRASMSTILHYYAIKTNYLQLPGCVSSGLWRKLLENMSMQQNTQHCKYRAVKSDCHIFETQIKLNSNTRRLTSDQTGFEKFTVA